ncbi:Asp-tRNA(Asn)/Glu-tRNA(Gln) amidotransferase subunit GatB [Breznakiella homolactica]|uniref:Aspartyl/glutamyl-tRNA(Asn/Gln) amidotransferase subunit B n=1 Tax=Breznakiella homolactica TaxID=2798577 RepID=A0A7T8BBT1_9SPIR|nr:Asp-tRNA(Asn)/Glu-tRNA(Gln) amidotransferase subunit GatB [Breznakiella homolactica]QQO10907.1 Asp-tRNA(Asn)/Glu-tRNA(Gln) amidotransferase subunit GatB [Breznakiella homolactica]
MYQSFIGLEVHIHLLTQTKVFCSCRSAFGDEPNTNVCPVCLGYPGVLPSLNREALRMGAVVARSLGCAIPEKTWFERKQYFYPDMPKNYQISQFASPLGQNGYLDIEGKGSRKRVRIRECHLEEDAGKMIHAGTVSLLDYNRAGMPLLEIVTEPDLETGEEAELFIRHLRRIVRYLGVCDGNMEEGSLRADANVSINLRGRGLGSKVEIKNLNSSRFVRLGLDYEIRRQETMLEEGRAVAQETRLWNENRDRTEPMRSKEDSKDYRYFPEPDLPVFVPDVEFLASVEAGRTELPLDRMKRLVRTCGVTVEQAELICDEKPLADYFEAAAAEARNLGHGDDAPGRIAAWLLSDVKRVLNRDRISPETIFSLALTPKRLAELAGLVSAGTVSGKNAREVLEAVLAEDKDPEAIIRERGWERITDPELIAGTVRSVCSREEKALSDIAKAMLDGNEKRRAALETYLVGKILAATGGRADPGITRTQLGVFLAAYSPDR